MRDAHTESGDATQSKTISAMSREFAVIVFWISAALCAIAEIAILRSVFVPRSSTGDPASMSHSPRGAEMLWAAIPAIGLAALFAATWRAIH